MTCISMKVASLSNDDLYRIARESFCLPEGSHVPHWKERPLDHFSSARYMLTAAHRVGKPAGTASRADGRRRVVFVCRGVNVSMYSYQIVWAFTHGRWPEHEIDHRDGDPTNDDPANLRAATHQQNLANIGIPKHNTSGFKGVAWRAARKCWRATIKVNRKNIHLGHFASVDEANAAYAAAAVKHFGEFARLSA